MTWRILPDASFERFSSERFLSPAAQNNSLTNGQPDRINMHLFRIHAKCLNIMQNNMHKKERQRKLMDVIRAKPAANQDQLQRALKRLGIAATQSSISRDLAALGVIKLNGTYRLPHLEPGESSLVDVLDIEKTGDHLIVLKTAVGQASVVAVRIDQEKFPEIVGTLAGDDTIFVAVKNQEAQSRAIRQILNLFKRNRK